MPCKWDTIAPVGHVRSTPESSRTQATAVPLRQRGYLNKAIEAVTLQHNSPGMGLTQVDFLKPPTGAGACHAYISRMCSHRIQHRIPTFSPRHPVDHNRLNSGFPGMEGWAQRTTHRGCTRQPPNFTPATSVNGDPQAGPSHQHDTLSITASYQPIRQRPSGVP